jgi:hypothetical protein
MCMNEYSPIRLFTLATPLLFYAWFAAAKKPETLLILYHILLIRNNAEFVIEESQKSLVWVHHGVIFLRTVEHDAL